MAERAREPADELICPHCGKEFQPELLEGSADRYRGFKCPNCRLFIAEERAEEPEEEAS